MVKRFNEKYTVGQAVEVRNNSGKIIRSTTTAQAIHWGYNNAVVQVDGEGFVHLRNVFPITEA